MNHRAILALFDNICALLLSDLKCRNLTQSLSRGVSAVNIIYTRQHKVRWFPWQAGPFFFRFKPHYRCQVSRSPPVTNELRTNCVQVVFGRNSACVRDGIVDAIRLTPPGRPRVLVFLCAMKTFRHSYVRRL